MTRLSGIAEIARAARVGDLDAINDALDGMRDYSFQVLRGRSAADREMRRDPPLPPVDQTELARVENWHYPSMRPAEPAKKPARVKRRRRVAA